MKKRVIIINVLILALVVLIGSEGKTRKTIHITDAKGQSVHVKLPVEKVVVLNSDAMEVIQALGGDDLVAGINDGVRKLA